MRAAGALALGLALLAWGAHRAAWAAPPGQGTVPTAPVPASDTPPPTAPPAPPPATPTAPPGAPSASPPPAAASPTARPPAAPTSPITCRALATPDQGSAALLKPCTAVVRLPAGLIPPGGHALADELAPAALLALGQPPAGQRFLGNGVSWGVSDAAGRALTALPAPAEVCFPAPPGARGVVRRRAGAADRGTRPPGWASSPTFTTADSLRCTRSRLPGSYALIGP